MGDIPLGLNRRLTVHVAVLGATELDASDEGNPRGGLGSGRVSWKRVSSGAGGSVVSVIRTRKLDEFAAALDNGKLDAIHDYLVDRG